MGRDAKNMLLGLAGAVLTGMLARKLTAGRQTDVDFRPAPQPGPDVIAGWERRPHVPVSEDKVF